MADPSGFVYIVDRYLEVSNVYHLRMGESVVTKDDAVQQKTRRLQKLATKIGEGVRAAKRNKRVTVIPDGQERGQTVTTTPEFLNNTKRRQRDILARIEKLPEWVPQPSNIKRATALLALDADEFLGCFPSPSYASDVLSELASWTVCPDVMLLAARDMIHMHAVELQRHLMRLITQVKLLKPGPDKGSISLTVEQLREFEGADSLQQRKDMVEALVENSAPRDPTQLFHEFEPLAKAPPVLAGWLHENRNKILKILINENLFFSDALQYVENFDDARKLCDDLVVYGLISTYAIWYSCSLDDPEEMASFRTSILFCTRILLDQERWEVCRQFAKFALGATSELNQRADILDKTRGIGMLTANLFFARIKAGETGASITEELGQWNIDGTHPRYKFLKLVLLRKFEDAAVIALSLLDPNTETGVPNMCHQEFAEWPILEDFRESEPGRKILALRTAAEVAKVG